MQVWITKYALTKGIFTIEAEETQHAGMILDVASKGGFTQYYHGEGKDWHRTEEAAKTRVREMIVKKKKSLEKTYAKLEKQLLLLEKP